MNSVSDLKVYTLALLSWLHILSKIYAYNILEHQQTWFIVAKSIEDVVLSPLWWQLYSASPVLQSMKLRIIMYLISCVSLLSEWSERVKQISKIWRRVPSEEKPPFLVCSISQCFVLLRNCRLAMWDSHVRSCLGKVQLAGMYYWHGESVQTSGCNEGEDCCWHVVFHYL